MPEGNCHPFIGVDETEEKEPFSLAPDVSSLNLLDGLYKQLLPHFSSKQFNVGCDETFDLGQGKSKHLCDEKGVQQVSLLFLITYSNTINSSDGSCERRGFTIPFVQVYVQFLNQVHDLVHSKYYKTMQYWGDIVLQ